MALELTKEAFDASRFAPHPAAELMYFSWEFVSRAGPDSGYRVSMSVNQSAHFVNNCRVFQNKDQSVSINPTAKTYREWLKESTLVSELVTKLKEEKSASV